jgi:hypothetical protein
MSWERVTPPHDDDESVTSGEALSAECMSKSAKRIRSRRSMPQELRQLASLLSEQICRVRLAVFFANVYNPSCRCLSYRMIVNGIVLLHESRLGYAGIPYNSSIVTVNVSGSIYRDSEEHAQLVPQSDNELLAEP